MDLKQNINKTDTLKNDLKLARNKINDKILSGGGTLAQTLNDVPNAINEMIKENYKKVAIGECNFKLQTELPYGSTETKYIPLNLTFTPQKVFLKIRPAFPDNQSNFTHYYSIEKTGSVKMEYSSTSYGVLLQLKEIKFDKNKIHLTPESGGDSGDGTIVGWIAIE